MNDILTIVIPTYNEKEYLLRKAVETVLNQTYPYIDLILINDGSTDDTQIILEEYAKQDSRIQLFTRERHTKFRTIAECFNIGLQNAKGKWWHHDAADCWHEPTFAEDIMDFLNGRNDVIGAHSDFVVHEYDGRNRIIQTDKTWKSELSAFENYLRFDHFGGMVFNMDICKQAGLWDVRFPRHQTREWTLRVLKFGNLVYVPKILWHFVYHEVDQKKNIASIKYRFLANIKNNINFQWDMLTASNVEAGRLAMMQAFQEFFQNPEWENERLVGEYADKLKAIKQLADEEASEPWMGEK